MTKLKIKEKISSQEENQIDPFELEDGDILYSANWDTILMVVEDENNQSKLGLVDLTDSQYVENREDFFETFTEYNDQFGPFMHVSSAKLKFTLGD